MNNVEGDKKGVANGSTEERVIQLVADTLSNIKAEDIRPENSLGDDLGADSLDTVELVMAIEESFGIEIPDESAESIATVQQAIDYVEKHL